MPIILESRGSEEDSSSSSVLSPRTIMHSSIETEVSDESITTVQAPSISETNKKAFMHKPLRRLFLNLTKSNRSPIAENNELPITADASTNVPLGPATYLRPLEHKLEPRTEPRFTSSLNLADISPDGSATMRDPLVEAQAIAQNRERTELILNGVESEDLTLTDLDTTASECSIRSDEHNFISEMINVRSDNERDLATEMIDVCEYHMSKGELEDGIKKDIAMYHEQMALAAARHRSHIPAWKNYIECYSKVISIANAK